MKRIISMILSVLMLFPSSAIVLAEDEVDVNIDEIEVIEFEEDNVVEDDVVEDNTTEDSVTESNEEDNAAEEVQNDLNEDKDNINQTDELTSEIGVQEVTGFGNLDVEDYDMLSAEEESDLL